MTTEIGAKSFSVFSKILMIIIFTGIFILLIYEIKHPNINTTRQNNIIALYLLLALMPIGIYLLILQLIYFPTGVMMDDELKQLSVKYMFKKQMVINIKEIASYKEITIRQSRAGTQYGVLVYLRNNKQVLFSDLSLDDYFPIEQFLYNSNIKSAGSENFSLILYYFSQW